MYAGWKAVERDVKIPHNLETTPLQIKTDSAAGSREVVYVYLYTAGGDMAGFIKFDFTSSPQYWLGYCTYPTNFPTK